MDKLLGGIFVFLSFSIFSQPPQYKVTKCSPLSTGFYFLTAMKPVTVSTNTSNPYYNLILDRNGDALYYQRFSGAHRICDFKILTKGLISYFHKNRFFIVDASFNTIDSVYCKNDLQTDNHELLLLPNGNYAMIGVEPVTMNLSSYKIFNHLRSAGSPTAQVLCSVVQEQDRNRNVVFEWHSKNYFEFSDVDTFYLSDHTKVDWTHINSIYADKDGNYLLSVRNFNEVTKVRRTDSSIVWRLGGKKNQFRFINDELKFAAQHDARLLSNGNLSLFDNGCEQVMIHPSAAKEYKLNEKKMTADLVWKYTPDATAHSLKGLGNVQKLKNGNSLVNCGTNTSCQEMFTVLSPGGEKVFELEFADTLRSYRVYNYPALPFPIKRPVVSYYIKEGRKMAEAEKGHARYLWSNGEKTRIIEVRENGKYQVWVPAGRTGFVSSVPLSLK